MPWRNHMRAGEPEITVVVPTRDRPAGLRRCLARLAGQTGAGRTDSGDSANRYVVASQLVTNCVVGHASVPFAATNNVGSTARLLLELPFDDAYPDAAGEDRDWCQRLPAPVPRIERPPEATVAHHQVLTGAGFPRQPA